MVTVTNTSSASEVRLTCDNTLVLSDPGQSMPPSCLIDQWQLTIGKARPSITPPVRRMGGRQAPASFFLSRSRASSRFVSVLAWSSTKTAMPVGTWVTRTPHGPSSIILATSIRKSSAGNSTCPVSHLPAFGTADNRAGFAQGPTIGRWFRPTSGCRKATFLLLRDAACEDSWYGRCSGWWFSLSAGSSFAQRSSGHPATPAVGSWPSSSRRPRPSPATGRPDFRGRAIHPSVSHTSRKTSPTATVATG